MKTFSIILGGGRGYAIWKAVDWHKLKMLKKEKEKKKKDTLAPNGDNLLNLDKSISWHSSVLSGLDKEVVITTCAFLMAQPSTFPNENNLPMKRQLNTEYQQ